MTGDASFLLTEQDHLASALRLLIDAAFVRDGATIGYAQVRLNLGEVNLSRARWDYMLSGHRLVTDLAVRHALATYFGVEPHHLTSAGRTDLLELLDADLPGILRYRLEKVRDFTLRQAALIDSPALADVATYLDSTLTEMPAAAAGLIWRGGEPDVDGDPPRSQGAASIGDPTGKPRTNDGSFYVLVGGWPASGKSTLASALATELGIALLSKDAIKEALMDGLGAPTSVEESRRLGVAAVHVLLRTALGIPAAVIDSTWFTYTKPLVSHLEGTCVEVRCQVPLGTARARYDARIRDTRHLDNLRDAEELWGSPVKPLGVGPLIEVDTSRPVDIADLAARIRSLRDS